jgi:hypothetical protein
MILADENNQPVGHQRNREKFAFALWDVGQKSHITAARLDPRHQLLRVTVLNRDLNSGIDALKLCQQWRRNIG